MAAPSHGCPSSTTSPRNNYSQHGYGLDAADVASLKFDHLQTQTKASKEYADDINDDSKRHSNTNTDSPQGAKYGSSIPSNETINLDNDNDNAEETSGRHSSRTSSPSEDSDVYADANSTMATPEGTAQQQLSNTESKATSISRGTATLISKSQRKRANTISTLSSRLDTSSPLSASPLTASVRYGRSRSTSLVTDKDRNTLALRMNPAPLTLNMCDNHPNADSLCPTLGTKLYSDHKLFIARPSDAFRNRQRKHHSYHHDLVPSSSASPSSIQHQDSTQELALKEEISNSLAQLKDTSSEAYDWEFWAKVIHQFDQVKQQHGQDLRDYICIGMPPSLRGMIWQVFSKSRHNSDVLELEYRELLNGVSAHEKLIRRDLARTFPSHTFFQQRDGGGQEMLFNVIKAYSLYDPQVGYCQGLPFIVGCLLLHMPDEAAFCVLVRLMDGYGLRSQFTPQMELLHERLFQYEELLMTHLPQVFRHLEAQGVRPTMYASQWFLALFSSRCPLNLAFRVLDMVFTEGTCIVLAVAIALLKKNQDSILTLEFEGLLGFLSSKIFDIYQEEPTDFVKDVFAVDISQRDLTKLSKKHRIKMAREAKILDKDNYLKAENYELSQQAKRLERSFIALEHEHGAIAKQVIESKMAMATTSDSNQILRHEISQLEQQINEHTTNKDGAGPEEDELGLFAQENAQLEQQNAQLECRLAEIEKALVDFKLKYAESENEYEQLRRSLDKLEKSSD